MGKASIYIQSTGELEKAAGVFIPYLDRSRHVAFYGEMGAGKTTFIKALCAKLGVVNMVNSPTFAIINEYYTDNKDTVYHIDLYRLQTVAELLDIGYEEYLGGQGYCFIEWPEKAEGFLPDDVILVHIERNPDESRTLHIEYPEN